MVAHFKIPMNVPHAATVAWRIETLLVKYVDRKPEHAALFELAAKLATVLEPYRGAEDPPREEAVRVAAEAAQVARALVDEIEKFKLGWDRLGQCVRNLFECLELGEEGAIISLRAGEDPHSAQRPV